MIAILRKCRCSAPPRGLAALACALPVAWAILLSGRCPVAWGDDTQLTGDWGGLRSTLSNKGFDVSATYTGETFDNLSGGIHRGTIYEDRLAVSLDIHPEKFSPWQGATAHATMYQIDGHGPSANLVGNFLDLSGYEALPSTRLFTLWLQQDLFGGRVQVRLGQLAMDDEFLISNTASNLVNASFGNPAINYANMIAGGPVYPVADPGLRVKLQPRDDITVLAAAFAADPGGSDCRQPVQICDPSGTTFSLSGGTLWLGEIQYSTNQGKSAKGLPGTYKLGFWHEVGPFADQHFGLDMTGTGVSLASPAAVRPLDYSSDFALYGVADQMLWRKPGTDDQGLSGFLRLGGAPADRNLVSFYADGGLSWKGLVPGRGSDIAVIGVAYAEISPAATALDRDLAALTPGRPVRDYESVVEISYLAQIRPWWTVQPDLQYVMHPGGDVPNPKDPAAPIHNALLLGVRTTITF
jgi:porin